MTWQKREFDKTEINHAGRILTSDTSSDQEKEQAIEVLDNWRAIHSYPMHTFQMRLRDKAKKLDKESLTAQRLKRVPAIINKLKRGYHGHQPSMKLFQMQDIGGCRAILSTVALARRLYTDHYLKGDLKHKLINKKDYITNPKEDGYRSLHLVYEYRSDKGKKEFNGLLTEIQIRTRLEHLWATAVETAGFFTRQAIKSNEGDKEWTDFFRLISSAFAIIENGPCVPNTPHDEKDLYAQIATKAEELNVIMKMKGWTSAMRFFDQEIKSKNKKKVKFFLLELDIVGEKLNISSYTEKEEQTAINAYSALEKRHTGRKDYDVVLVGADTSNDLKNAYPNYFVDTGEFLTYLQKIINKQ
jgi:ppGpp synthetase/RelA/SpoT-type nucleotidyltranferase